MSGIGYSHSTVCPRVVYDTGPGLFITVESDRRNAVFPYLQTPRSSGIWQSPEKMVN
jgi:hypothetical protein